MEEDIDTGLCTSLQINLTKFREFVAKKSKDLKLKSQTNIDEKTIKQMSKDDLCLFIISYAPEIMQMMFDELILDDNDDNSSTKPPVNNLLPDNQTPKSNKKQKKNVNNNSTVDNTRHNKNESVYFPDKVIYKEGENSQEFEKFAVAQIDIPNLNTVQEQKVAERAKNRSNPLMREKFDIPLFDESHVKNFGKKCLEMGKLLYANAGNSCYMDSVLMVLFTVYEDFTNRYIFSKSTYEIPVCKGLTAEKDKEVRRSLRGMLAFYHDKLAKGENMECPLFRSSLQKCQLGGFEKFWENKVQESGEFLDYLFRIFEINIATTFVKTMSRIRGTETWDQDSSGYVIDYNARPILFINPRSLKSDTTSRNLVNIVTIAEAESGPLIDGVYKYDLSMAQNSIYDSPILVIACNRLIDMSYLGEETVFNSNKIAPDDEIVLSYSGRKLRLVAIVLHHYPSQHYTSLLRCQNQWIHYNDLEKDTPMRKVGTFEEMLGYQHEIASRQGSLYFYL